MDGASAPTSGEQWLALSLLYFKEGKLNSVPRIVLMPLSLTSRTDGTSTSELENRLLCSSWTKILL